MSRDPDESRFYLKLNRIGAGMTAAGFGVAAGLTIVGHYSIYATLTFAALSVCGVAGYIVNRDPTDRPPLTSTQKNFLANYRSSRSENKNRRHKELLADAYTL